MGLSDLDGLLTGVVVGPELIMPSERTRVVWGGEGPDFESVEEALAIHGTITGRCNQIRRRLDTAPRSFDPVFRKGPGGEAIVTDLAAGFLLTGWPISLRLKIAESCFHLASKLFSTKVCIGLRPTLAKPGCLGAHDAGTSGLHRVGSKF
jgi:hypothetical protein